MPALQSAGRCRSNGGHLDATSPFQRSPQIGLRAATATDEAVLDSFRPWGRVAKARRRTGAGVQPLRPSGGALTSQAGSTGSRAFTCWPTWPRPYGARPGG